MPSVQRIADRFPFETRIRIRVTRGGQTLALGGWTRDLSETGVSAFVAESIEHGEEVELDVPLGDGVHPTIPARTARSLGTQYGFEFTALSAAQRAGIRAVTKGKAPLTNPRGNLD